MVGWLLFVFVIGWLSGVVCSVKAMEKKYREVNKK